MNFIVTLGAFVLALGILVTIHEYGHYLAARFVGVKVLRFSVGFGKPIWARQFKPGGTEWVVAAIPLGGYVKMADEREDTVSPEDAQVAFNRQPFWGKALIVTAGPIFNLLFAVLAYTFLYTGELQQLHPVVGEIRQGAYGEQFGFKSNDRIVSVDGLPVSGWGEHDLYLMRKALLGRTVSFEVFDASGRKQLRRADFSQLNLRTIKGSVMSSGLGISPKLQTIPAVAGAVEQGPGKRAGLKPGDRFVSINGEKIESWRQLVKTVQAHAGKTMIVIIERNGVQQKLEITPDTVERDGVALGRINVAPEMLPLPDEYLVKKQYGLTDALRKGVNDTIEMSTIIYLMMYKMIVLEVSSENISGPITIAEYAGKSAQIGLDSFLMFLAVVSISLGALNLLPIPILDGGHLVIHTLEAIKGSALSDNMLAMAQQVGIAMLAGLMLLAFYNDLTRIFS